ncbi:PH domain-containing protein [Paenibacillus daejeonensis]|uniref:PH domain-containing protein n=1 Tax=Paenibacillus daejeonensis TaxID=135193 RepID=UPI000367D2B2|nr:PH domain-containing protein [Paenibacillus daejeonensis]
MKKSEDMKRLHPLSVIFFIGKTIKDLLYPLIVFFLTTIFRENVNYHWLFGGASLFLVLLIVISVLTWLRFTYAIEPGGLRVEHGVFVRKKLWIGKERVQSVDTTAGILHRLFGLKKLQVETAGGKKPEAELNGITWQEGLRISRGLGMSEAERVAVADGDNREAAPEHPSEANESVHSQRTTTALPATTLAVRKLGIGDLAMYSATSGKIGVVLAVAAAAFSQLSDWLAQTFDVWGFISEWSGSRWVVLLVLLLLTFAWLLAFIGSFVKEYGFTLQLREDKLVIERGLLERNQITVPLRRIQAVHLIEPLLRRPFGWVTVHIVTAGYAGKEGQSALLFPFIRKKELPGFLEQFAPQFQMPDQWERLERRALRHYLLLPMVFTILVCIPAIIWIPENYGWLSLILPVITLIGCLLGYRQTGWALSDDQISIQYGSFNKHQGLVPKRRVQWHRVSQSIFQRRRSLAHLTLSLASGAAAASFSIRHAPQQSAESLSNWLSLRRRERDGSVAIPQETDS